MDAMPKLVYDTCLDAGDKSAELRELLDANPDLDVNQHRDARALTALHAAASVGNKACLRLLVDADVNLETHCAGGASALYLASRHGNAECLEVLIESKADVQTSNCQRVSPVHSTTQRDHRQCLAMLIAAGADVNARSDGGDTPTMEACYEDRLACLQLLVDSKSDLNSRCEMGRNSLYWAMRFPRGRHTPRRPSMTFAVLSCNTDCQSVQTGNIHVTRAVVKAHANEYKRVHSFIDEYQAVTKHTLSEDAVVDTRVGRNDYGLYHEPLERILEYLGLSMEQNQTVNTSIDGEGSITRALIPGHPTNASLWFELYQQQ